MKSFALFTLTITLLIFIAPASSQAQLQPGQPCLVPGPGYSTCAGNVNFSSYYTNGPLKPFQATGGTGVQPNISVSFSKPIYGYRVFVNDPDYTNYVRYQSPFNSFYWNIAGDNNPGVFSVGFLGVNNTNATLLTLISNSSDYVNWRVEYRASSTGPLCKVTAQNTTCDGVTVSVSPWWQGSPFDPFQAVDNYSGPQGPIDITFEIPLYSVSVTAVDPDYGGNRMEAYADDGTLLNTAYFNGDNVPGQTTTDAQTITDARGIRRIRLVNNPDDYIAFQGLTATPGF